MLDEESLREKLEKLLGPECGNEVFAMVPMWIDMRTPGTRGQVEIEEMLGQRPAAAIRDDLRKLAKLARELGNLLSRPDVSLRLSLTIRESEVNALREAEASERQAKREPRQRSQIRQALDAWPDRLAYLESAASVAANRTDTLEKRQGPRGDPVPKLVAKLVGLALLRHGHLLSDADGAKYVHILRLLWPVIGLPGSEESMSVHWAGWFINEVGAQPKNRPPTV